jgi:hypothetical protein
MTEKIKTIEKLEDALGRIDTKENVIYFLCYDTRGNARAAIKHIYDMALFLKDAGYDAKILVEESTYKGVDTWLGDKYNSLPVVSIKENKVEMNIDDVLIVPEHYANVLQQLSHVKCTKIMLIQQKEYMYETLPIGSRFSDYGFDKIITTSNSTKKYLQEYFPESLIFVIPPVIEDYFTKTDKMAKPYIAISCRDRVTHRKIISEFYLKYPHLRWVTFRDMVQMSNEEFAQNLKECFVSVWIDDDSTFGTFPLESMKSNVPVIGKIPMTEPDWLDENGFWTYDESKIIELLGTYCVAWLEGVELNDEVIEKMKEAILPYEKEITKNNVLNIFESFNSKRKETISKSLEKLKTEETV